MNDEIFAKLCLEFDEYQMKKKSIIVGRNNNLYNVDLDMGASMFVSRRHLEIVVKNFRLKVKCLGKNGIFIDEDFKPKSDNYYPIPHKATLRFPNTQMKIQVESYVSKRKGSDNIDIIKPPKIIELNKSDQRDVEQLNCEEVNKKITENELLSTTEKLEIYSFGGRRKQKFIHSSEKLPLRNSSASFENKNTINHDYQNPQITPEPSQDSSENEQKQMIPHIENFENIENIKSISAESSTVVTTTPTPYFFVDRGDPQNKPPYSYAQLITQAIVMSPDRQITLAGIYNYIGKNYPYYAMSSNKGWQNSIRHNLSLNRHFIKVPRTQEETGKGSFWRIDPVYEIKLISHAFRKRRYRASINLTNMTFAYCNNNKQSILLQPESQKQLIMDSNENNNSTTPTTIQHSINRPTCSFDNKFHLKHSPNCNGLSTKVNKPIKILVKPQNPSNSSNNNNNLLNTTIDKNKSEFYDHFNKLYTFYVM